MDFEVDQHRIGVFSTWEVNRVTEGVGFKTHIYGDYSEIHWDEEKDERPVFVCKKPL